jgi:hypothetical protein
VDNLSDLLGVRTPWAKAPQSLASRIAAKEATSISRS